MPEFIRKRENELRAVYLAYIVEFSGMRERLEGWVAKQFHLTTPEAQDVVAESIPRAIKAFGGPPVEPLQKECFTEEDLKAGQRMGFQIVRTAALDYLNKYPKNRIAEIEPSSVPGRVENPGFDRVILHQLHKRLDRFYEVLADELTRKERDFQQALEQLADRHGWGETRDGRFLFCIFYLNNTGRDFDAPPHEQVSEELRAALCIQVNYCNVLAKRLRAKWLAALHPLAGGLR